MEYLVYLSVVLGIVALCVLLFRPPSVDPEPVDERLHTDRIRPVLARELRKVPTPWGWPGAERRAGRAATGNSAAGLATDRLGTLQTWVDRLVAEKRTIDDDAYLLRKNESLRALIEDRYGSANGASAIVYRKTRPPMLQDPQRPPDQMDNFPAGKTDRIVAGLAQQPKSTARRPELSSVKTPWGW